MARRRPHQLPDMAEPLHFAQADGVGAPLRLSEHQQMVGDPRRPLERDDVDLVLGRWCRHDTIVVPTRLTRPPDVAVLAQVAVHWQASSSKRGA